MADVIIKLNDAGMQALLKSPGVQGDLMRRASQVARAAGDGVEARSTPRARRGRAEATTNNSFPRTKSKRATMTAAISAARG